MYIMIYQIYSIIKVKKKKITFGLNNKKKRFNSILFHNQISSFVLNKNLINIKYLYLIIFNMHQKNVQITSKISKKQNIKSLHILVDFLNTNGIKQSFQQQNIETFEVEIFNLCKTFCI